MSEAEKIMCVICKNDFQKYRFILIKEPPKKQLLSISSPGPAVVTPVISAVVTSVIPAVVASRTSLRSSRRSCSRIGMEDTEGSHVLRRIIPEKATANPLAYKRLLFY